jgi:protein subunit release factor B
MRQSRRRQHDARVGQAFLKIEVEDQVDFGLTQKKQAELEARMAALGVREADLEERFIHSSGPGGQRVNKTASCVYLRHLPSGVQVKMQQERQQRLNRYYARKRLCELLEHQRLGAQSPEALRADKIRKQKQRRRRRRRIQ